MQNDTAHHLGKSLNNELKDRPQEEGKCTHGRRHNVKRTRNCSRDESLPWGIQCLSGVSDKGKPQGTQRRHLPREGSQLEDEREKLRTGTKNTQTLS